MKKRTVRSGVTAAGLPPVNGGPLPLYGLVGTSLAERWAFVHRRGECHARRRRNVLPLATRANEALSPCPDQLSQRLKIESRPS